MGEGRELDQVQSAITHLPALDGVRGLAILLVIACHTSDHLELHAHWISRGGRAMFLTFGAGWIGVDLFFVLSGFLITRILLATRERPHYFKNFYARRALRILPLYLAFCGAMWLQSMRHPTPGDRGDLLSLIFYYNNFREAFFSFHIAAALQCWSLAVEEHFYMLWPFVIAFAPPRQLRTICLFGIALSFGARVLVIALGVPGNAVYVLTPCRLDGLLVGAWLADAFRNPEVWSQVRRYGRSVLTIAALGLGMIVVYQHHGFDWMLRANRSDLPKYSEFGFAPVVFLLALFFGGLLVESISGSWFSSFMRLPWLRALGKYSYGIYLFHLYIMIQCRIVLARLAPGAVGNWMLEPFFFALVAVVTFACASVSYHLFEEQFLKLKRLFASSSEAA
jgi:peptidoglycan/LPS O-acetylase OafA/YrhL